MTSIEKAIAWCDEKFQEQWRINEELELLNDMKQMLQSLSATSVEQSISFDGIKAMTKAAFNLGYVEKMDDAKFDTWFEQYIVFMGWPRILKSPSATSVKEEDMEGSELNSCRESNKFLKHELGRMERKFDSFREKVKKQNRERYTKKTDEK